MSPGVPFALVGAVQLLAVAAWVGLGAATVARLQRSPGGLRTPGLAAPVLLSGVVVLAVVDSRTALRFGSAEADDLALLRALGLLLLGAGVVLGALGPRWASGLPGTGPAGLGRRGARVQGAGSDPARDPEAFPMIGLAPVALSGVVVPLGSGAAPALLAGVAGLLAALGCLRARKDPVGVVLALALLLSGAAAVVAVGAGDGPGPALTVLLLRGAGALAGLGVVGLLARASLLGKVVAATLAGVLAMAVAAVGVVGTVVVASYDDQSRTLVTDAAAQRALDLQGFAADQQQSALFALVGCGGGATAGRCRQALNQVTPAQDDAFVRVPRSGSPQVLADRGAPPGPPVLAALSRLAPVQASLTTPSQGEVAPRTALVALPDGLAAVGVVAEPGQTADGLPTSVLVYLARIGDAFLARDLDASRSVSLSLFVGDDLVASNGSQADRQAVLRAAPAVGLTAGSLGEGRTSSGVGGEPTVRFVPLRDPAGQVGVVAVSRDAAATQRAQRDALQGLVLTALATTAVVGALALLLGRQTVRPVRRLTEAAGRVAGGDLTVRTAEPGRDEVGTLSRAFDAMTTSLEALTGDLRSTATRLQTVLTSMNDGLVATDDGGLVTSINPAALAMLGLDGAVGRPLTDVVHLEDEGLLLAGTLHGEDAVVRAPDGTVTPVRLELGPLEDGSGQVLVLRDTAREREVERMKTEFLSNVSHELRTPLTPIRGYADLLVSRPNLTPAQVSTFAGTILSESLKLNRVVDLLVDVASIEAGRVQVTPREVALTDLLEPRLAAWRKRVPERAGDLRRRVAAGLPCVRVDPTWLGKALDELVDNALKYSTPGTPVVLGARPAQDGLVGVYVSDQGPGISEADQAGLFSSFEQVDGSATRRVGGLGLGLSFVRRLAEDAGYGLLVASRPGWGATFTLEVPPA